MLAWGTLFTSGGASAVAEDPAPAWELQAEELAQALKFRRTFGFEANQGMVLNFAKDPDYSAADYGVPLSKAERAEMLRRIDVERAAQPAVDYGLAQADWAGYRIDQLAQGEPVFFFAGDTVEHESRIAKIMGQGSFRVERVERTLADLLELQARINSDTDVLVGQGLALTLTAVDISRNRVTVGVSGLTERDRGELYARYGESLIVRGQGVTNSDACSGATGTLDCRPMKGGLKITRIPSPGNSCTAGFIVRRALNGAQLSVLTAGHCLYDTSGNNNVNFLWKHNGSQFGDSKYHTWGPEKGADVGLVEIDNNSADMPTSANKMWLYNGTSGAIYTITYATPSQYQTAGVQACAYGYFSNDSECGVILSEYNVRNLSRAWGINNYITNTWEYDINLVSGDSGGPIYQVLSGTSRAALGTHVHSDDDPNSNGIGWYSPWDVGRTYYINYTPDSFEMCITAAC